MAKRILVLEDNADRCAAMRQWLGDRLAMCELFVTDDPPAFLAALRDRPDDVLAVSLDHDLHERPDGNTTVTGMDVVDHLVTLPPTFPVLMHTSNTRDGERMRSRLTAAGWGVTWVTPFDDTAWVGADWYPTLKRAIRAFARRQRADADVDTASR